MYAVIYHAFTGTIDHSLSYVRVAYTVIQDNYNCNRIHIVVDCYCCGIATVI